MTKKELIRNVAMRAGLSRSDANRAVNAVLSEIKAGLSDGDNAVRIAGFGAFRVIERAARTGRNPRTGESIEIPAKRVIRFKVGRAFQSMVA